MSAYASGGINDYTGIAMLHGTPSKPEAVLNPEETKVYRDFVQSLMRISVNGFKPVNSERFGDSNPVTISQIVVQVDKLDSDADYDRMAAKVAKVFQRDLTIKNGAPVGVMRF